MKVKLDKFDIEQTFILDVLRGLAHKNPSSSLFFGKTFAHLNWQRIIKISSQQKVMGFVSHAAHEQGWVSALSPEVQEIFKNALLEYRFLNEEKKMQFIKISALLEREGIGVIPLKGIYLSFIIYEDMPYRSMDDIDILIPTEHSEKVIKILEKEGFMQAVYPFRSRWHTQIFQEVFVKDDFYWKRLGRNGYTDGRGLNIDIHWEPYYIIGTERVTFDSNFFWESVVSGTRFGKNVYMIPQDRHLLFLSAHTADQYTPSLVQLFDIALSMRKIPEALACLEKETKDWPSLVRDRLLHCCSIAQDIFLCERPISNLSDETKRFLKDFFKLKGKRERHDPCMVLSIRQKIKFLVGYFIPEPSYYRERNPWVMYRRHWGFIIKKVYFVLLQRFIVRSNPETSKMEAKNVKCA